MAQSSDGRELPEDGAKPIKGDQPVREAVQDLAVWADGIMQSSIMGAPIAPGTALTIADGKEYPDYQTAIIENKIKPFATNNTASGIYSHAEGSDTEASGDSSHAEGRGTIASGDSSHAEGSDTEASGDFSHAEGSDTEASGDSSHAEGRGTIASGDSSHVEGSDTEASGDSSHAEGRGTIASGDSSHVEGQWNVNDSENLYQAIVGNGTSNNDRKNIFTRSWKGVAWAAKDFVCSGDDEASATYKLSDAAKGAPLIVRFKQGTSADNVITVTTDTTFNEMMEAFSANRIIYAIYQWANTPLILRCITISISNIVFEATEIGEAGAVSYVISSTDQGTKWYFDDYMIDMPLNTNDITTNAITTTKIADKAVTGAKLADNAIDEENSDRIIGEGAIIEKMLAASSVRAATIKDEAVTMPKLAPSIKTLLETLPSIDFGTSNALSVPQESHLVVDVTFGSAKTEAPLVFCSIQQASADTTLIANVQSVTNTQTSIVITNPYTVDATNVTLDWLAISGR